MSISIGEKSNDPKKSNLGPLISDGVRGLASAFHNRGVRQEAYARFSQHAMHNNGDLANKI